MAPLNGMAMMLKSFGLDPEVLTKGMEDFKQVAVNAQNALIAVDAKCTIIREMQIQILQKLDLLLQNPVLNEKPRGQIYAEVMNQIEKYPQTIGYFDPVEVGSVAHEDELEEIEVVKNG